MTYRLIKVGEAAYDVAQGVRIVARLDQERPRGYWRAELVARVAADDLPKPSGTQAPLPDIRGCPRMARLAGDHCDSATAGAVAA